MRVTNGVRVMVIGGVMAKELGIRATKMTVLRLAIYQVLRKSSAVVKLKSWFN